MSTSDPEPSPGPPDQTGIREMSCTREPQEWLAPPPRYDSFGALQTDEPTPAAVRAVVGFVAGAVMAVLLLAVGGLRLVVVFVESGGSVHADMYGTGRMLGLYVGGCVAGGVVFGLGAPLGKSWAGAILLGIAGVLPFTTACAVAGEGWRGTATFANPILRGVTLVLGIAAAVGMHRASQEPQFPASAAEPADLEAENVNG
jgi:hypothetical protein